MLDGGMQVEVEPAVALPRNEFDKASDGLPLGRSDSRSSLQLPFAASEQLFDGALASHGTPWLAATRASRECGVPLMLRRCMRESLQAWYRLAGASCNKILVDIDAPPCRPRVGFPSSRPPHRAPTHAKKEMEQE